jgi:hypothetical protein
MPPEKHIARYSIGQMRTIQNHSSSPYRTQGTEVLRFSAFHRSKGTWKSVFSLLITSGLRIAYVLHFVNIVFYIFITNSK